MVIAAQDLEICGGAEASAFAPSSSSSSEDVAANTAGVREVWDIPYAEVKELEDSITKDIDRSELEAIATKSSKINMPKFDVRHPETWDDNKFRDIMISIHRGARYKGCRALHVDPKKKSLEGLQKRVRRVISRKHKTVDPKDIVKHSLFEITGTPHITKMRIHRQQPSEGTLRKETDAFHRYDEYHGDAYWTPMYYAAIHVKARALGKTMEEARHLAWLSVINILGVECGYDYGGVINKATIEDLRGEDAEAGDESED